MFPECLRNGLQKAVQFVPATPQVTSLPQLYTALALSSVGGLYVIINIMDTTSSSIRVTLGSKHAKFEPKLQAFERSQTISIIT